MPPRGRRARQGVGRVYRFAASAAVAALAALPAGAAAAPAGAGRVLATTVDGTITPVMADHLADAIERAAGGGYRALVVELDTPGGLDSAMRDMVQAILASPVPVIAYVHPAGARAASAGAIIAFAAHVAAMAPATAIGAATPVDLEGGDVERKIVNDAAAYAESIARLRGRDVGFAGDTVREGRSAPAAEAVELGAVDLVAPSVAELLQRVDGRTVAVGEDERPVTLAVAGAAVDRHGLGLFRRIQQWLADPNLAYLFLSLGTVALVLELASPGVGAGGVVGAILLLLAMASLAVLPVNVVGLLLVGLAAALFVVELYVPGVGVAAAGGAVALVVAGVLLFDDAPGLSVSAAVLVPVAVAAGGGALVAGRIARSVRRAPPRTGAPALVGRTVTVGRADATGGWAHLEGAWWHARARDGEALAAGDQVTVVAVDGLDLVVEAGGVRSGTGEGP